MEGLSATKGSWSNAGERSGAPTVRGCVERFDRTVGCRQVSADGCGRRWFDAHRTARSNGRSLVDDREKMLQTARIELEVVVGKFKQYRRQESGSIGWIQGDVEAVN